MRRFVQRLRPGEPEAFVRVHTAPGEELQVDFGSIGLLFDPVSGQLRPAYVFVATLGYSPTSTPSLCSTRKCRLGWPCTGAPSKASGGVPRRVVPDNLKAAVLKILVQDPILGEAYRRLALHYNFLVSPT
ncbi:MAG: IS21 family transposase, partial [Chloroflexi bacterium]|nr:IS21 family transposase [Chloroflexota bacterium]